MSKKAKFILTTISIFLLLIVLQIQMPKDVFASEGVSFDKFNFCMLVNDMSHFLKKYIV